MENILNNAFSILAIGMITVLLILALVVVVGNLLIRVTNKYWPLPEGPGKDGKRSSAIHSGTLAAIVAAVEIVTAGKGKITNIEKE